MHYDEFERLRAEEEKAFQRKEEAREDYMVAKEAASVAYETVQLTLEDRCAARDELNREFEALQEVKERNNKIWAAFRQSRDYYGSCIDSLRPKADAEHQAMRDCFEQANRAYECGEKAIAPRHSAEGHEHRTRRNELNARIRQLRRKIREMRQDAERRAPRPDYSAFDATKAKFDKAKAANQEAQARFKAAESKSRQAKEEFNKASAEYWQAHTALRSRLSKSRATDH